jgi:hypothetical protein
MLYRTFEMPLTFDTSGKVFVFLTKPLKNYTTEKKYCKGSRWLKGGDGSDCFGLTTEAIPHILWVGLVLGWVPPDHEFSPGIVLRWAPLTMLHQPPFPKK